MIIIEGFDPHPVSGQKQRFFATIPNGQSKHTYKFIQALSAPVLICLQNNFRIRIASKTVAI